MSFGVRKNFLLVAGFVGLIIGVALGGVGGPPTVRADPGPGSPLPSADPFYR